MFMKHLLTNSYLLLCSIGCICFTQNSLALIPTNAKRLQANRIIESPRIDAKLDDIAWQGIEAATNFTTFEPTVGLPATQKTSVKVTYDNAAIYIAAYLYDESPDSILRQLGTRDSWNINADMFEVDLDTYDDDQNAFGFAVTASGIQNDTRFSTDGDDPSWDAVWQSAIDIKEDGWVVEMKIPYTALRFPEKEVQNWGIGFRRVIRRIREQTTWQGFQPSKDGIVNQFGTLEGLKGIQPPLRLSVTPYASVYVDTYKDKEDKSNNSNSRSIKGGLDVKYGINESFTLDMMLIPDFGQVQSDDQVLNLSPFEVRFNENRPFFIEGTELFDRGGIFYSRRIGGLPSGFYNVEDDLGEGEKIIANPSSSQLYNATKISGRTKKNVGVGFFNAVSAPTYATIENAEGERRTMETEPLANYNIVVVDKALKNRSFVSLTNTNVMRLGSSRDANVTALAFRLANKENKYAVKGNVNLSQVFDKELKNKPEFGYKYFWEAAKVSGKWQYGVWQNVESDKYDPNDLGFLLNNNEFSNSVFLQYRIFQPVWRLVNGSFRINFNDYRLYENLAFQEFNINYNSWFTFRNFNSMGVNAFVRPMEGYDAFEPRVGGRSSVVSTYFGAGGWFSRDYRKKFALDAEGWYGVAPLYDGYNYELRLAPRFRFSDKFSLILDARFNHEPVNSGYATDEEVGEETQVIFGIRDVSAVINRLTAAYTFTSNMGLNLRARHYASKVVYDSYHLLQEDGYLADEVLKDYEKNRTFNAVNVDLVYSWQFSPGSLLSIVWKNTIFQSDDIDSDNYHRIVSDNYWNRMDKTFAAPQRNSLSVRILYYLDYQMLQKHKS